jgi:hypothetical protein
LSEDAVTVVNLLTEAPAELCTVMRPGKAKQVRQFLWRQVKEFGWTMARCTEAFDEIREALG